LTTDRSAAEANDATDKLNVAPTQADAHLLKNMTLPLLPLLLDPLRVQ
jgi:hypothetical protein